MILSESYDSWSFPVYHSKINKTVNRHVVFLDFETVFVPSNTCVTAPKATTPKVKRRQELFETSRDKTNNVAVRPAKTQISLGIRSIWSESSLCAQWVAKGPSFLHADSEDSDQTGRMPRLIWVFAGRALTLLVLSRGGSFYTAHFSCMSTRVWFGMYLT